MKSQRLEIKTALQIQKPADEIYEAIADPVKMSNYFISHGSGRMEQGKEVMWRFPEFDFEFPVRVSRMEKPGKISFHWDADDIELLVEITLESRPDGSTLVNVTEKSREADEAGLKWLSGNTAGWANFLACLKAWLEYGINLRKGAFNYLTDKT
jgi:uncharacterized protein YndB with AHSA1/START domain